MLEDGRAVVASLLSTGVRAENVTFYGHSLGGAVAALLRVQFPGGPLIIDRSFSSLDAVPLSAVRKSSLPRCLKAPIVAVLPGVMTLLQWRLNVLDQWDAICRSTVRRDQMSSDGTVDDQPFRVLVVYHEQDDIIDYEHASLHRAVADTLGDTGVCCIRLKSRGGSPHNMWLRDYNQYDEIVDWVDRMVTEPSSRRAD